MIRFLDENFDKAKAQIKATIQADVRAELVHLMKLYRKFVIGRGDSVTKPTGVLTTATKGSYAPSEPLNLPRWAPRGAKYLRHKTWNRKNRGWFAYDGYMKGAFTPLRDQWSGVNNSGGGGVFATRGSDETKFETLFGPVSVEVIRNNSGWGIDTSASIGPTGQHVKRQMATIRVRALGDLSLSMLKTGSGYNAGLMGLVARQDLGLSYRLGNAWKYRPSLEPFLAFFLERSIGQAVTERLRRGSLTKTLFR